MLAQQNNPNNFSLLNNQRLLNTSLRNQSKNETERQTLAPTTISAIFNQKRENEENEVPLTSMTPPRSKRARPFTYSSPFSPSRKTLKRALLGTIPFTSPQKDGFLTVLQEIRNKPREEESREQIEAIFGQTMGMLGVSASPSKLHRGVVQILHEKKNASPSTKRRRRHGIEILTSLKSLLREHPKLASDKVTTEFLNMDHMTRWARKKKKITGFHFCPVGHPDRHKLSNIIVSSQGVEGAIFTLKKKSKFSTFFPAEIKTEQELFNVIMANIHNRIIEKDNYALVQLPNNLVVNVATVTNGIILHTVFPMFYYSTYSSNRSFMIQKEIRGSQKGLKLASRRVFAFLQSSLRRGESPVKYKGSDFFIVDIAKEIREQGISWTAPKNILFRFSAEDFAAASPARRPF